MKKKLNDEMRDNSNCKINDVSNKRYGSNA